MGQQCDKDSSWSGTWTPSVRIGQPAPGKEEDYEVDPKRVREGLETRTTCMIRNIPNELTQAMLQECIVNSGVPQEAVMFMHMPVDFVNKCFGAWGEAGVREENSGSAESSRISHELNMGSNIVVTNMVAEHGWTAANPSRGSSRGPPCLRGSGQEEKPQDKRCEERRET